MFNPSEPYQYSIDVAARLYRDVSSQEEMTRIVENSIKEFFSDLGLEFTMVKQDRSYVIMNKYQTSEQDIDVVIDKSGNITSFCLNMYQPYSEQLLKDAYYNHIMFGAPVFAMIWLTDLNRATITIMSREDYIKMDNPESRMFQQRMNNLDSLINKFGGWE